MTKAQHGIGFDTPISSTIIVAIFEQQLTQSDVSMNNEPSTTMMRMAHFKHGSLGESPQCTIEGATLIPWWLRLVIPHRAPSFLEVRLAASQGPVTQNWEYLPICKYNMIYIYIVLHQICLSTELIHQLRSHVYND